MSRKYPQNASGIENGDRRLSLGRKFLSLPTLFSFTIAISVIVFLALRFDLDWKATWGNVRNASPGFYVLAFVVYYLSFFFRGWRWRILGRNAQIDKAPGARLPSIFRCSQFILLGWFANTVTWFRLGDAYRAYEFSRESRGGFPQIMGTVLAERVLDMAVVFVLMIAGAVYLSTDRGLNASPVFLLAAFGMVGALIALILLMSRFGMRLSRWLPRRFQGMYERFHYGTMGSFKNLPIVFGLSVIGWFLEVARLLFVVQALNIDLSLSLILFVALASALLSTVPITPGGLGFVEPGIVGILMLSLARHDAVSIALVDRSISYVSVVVFGGLLFLALQILRARSAKQGGVVAEATGSAEEGT